MSSPKYCSRRSVKGHSRAGFHERPHEVGEFFALDTAAERDAGHAGSVEQVGETALGGGRFEGHAVQEELRTGSAQKQAAPGSLDGFLSSFHAESNWRRTACSKP